MRYLFILLLLCSSAYAQTTPIASPVVDNSLTTNTQQYLNTLYNAVKSIQNGTYVLGPTTTTSNNIPQWSSTNLTLTNGLTVGTASNNIVQLNSSGQLPAVDGSLLTNLPGGYMHRTIYASPGTFTFNKPSGVNTIFVEVLGGGGGGQTGAGGSGGAGGYSNMIYTITGNVTVVVGAGGGSGFGGGTSSFDTISATGGSTGGGVYGGAGGSGSGGDINITGQTGGLTTGSGGSTIYGAGGGGGGSANATGYGAGGGTNGGSGSGGLVIVRY